VRLAPLCLSVLGAACLLGAGPAGSTSEVIEKDIAKQLQDAMAAKTDDAAEAKFREAETILKGAAARLDPLIKDFLDADIMRNRGTAGVTIWQRDRKQTQALDSAQLLLRKALGIYRKLLLDYSDKADRIRERIDTTDPAANREFKDVWLRICWTKYWLAWTAYNLGISSDATQDRTEYFSEAIKQFNAFTAEGYKNDPMIIKCFRGQAMCLLELREPDKALDLLKNATEANTPHDLYSQIVALRFKACRSLPSPEAAQQADALAQRYLDSLKPEHRWDPAELRMAVECAQYLARQADPKTNPATYMTFKTRLEKIARLVAPYGDPWKATIESLTKSKTTSPAREHLINARRYYDAKQFREAVAEAQQGLKVPTKDESPQTFTELRYLILASYWNQKEWRSGHLAAFDFLKAHKSDPRARDVCVKAFQAGIEALAAQPPLTQKEFQLFLDYADREFHGAVDAQKVVYRQGYQLIQAKQFREAQGTFAKVPVYGIAYAAFYESENLATQARRDPAAVAELLKSSAEALRRFMTTTAPGQMSPEDERTAANALNLALITGKRLLALPDPSPRVAESLLESLDKWLWAKEKAVKKREALRLAVSVRTGDVADALKRVDGLLAKPDPNDSDLAESLTAIADPLETHYQRCLRQSDAATASALGERLVSIYSFLCRYAARGRDAASNEQAIATGRRLASWLLRMERYDAAIQQYLWLLQKVPVNKAGDLIRGLGLAYEAKKNYVEAIKQWGLLSGPAGFKEETEGWFEARYHLITCHMEAGHQDQAQMLTREFCLMCPKGATGDWAKRFEALVRKVGPGPAAGNPPVSLQ
jgi:hypothetical protein